MVFLDSFASNCFFCHISQPTRIYRHPKTLFDKVFSNFNLCKIMSGNITGTIPDHLPTFFVPNILSNLSSQISNFYERDWSQLKQEDFILDHSGKDWYYFLQVDLQYANKPFYRIFLKQYELHLYIHNKKNL